MNKNIFLIGFMGAGKSTIARFLKEKYGMRLIEMDEQIEAEQGKKISRIFEESGEECFRQMETELLERQLQSENTVVSCGGGVPMRQRNVDVMRKSGAIIYLSADPETIYERVKNNHNRPLLEGHMNVSYIAELLNKRMPNYLAAADIIVATDGRSTGEIGKEIIEKIKGCNN